MSTLLLWILLLFIGRLKAISCFCPISETAHKARHTLFAENAQQSRVNHEKDAILGTVRIDYSAANEYIRAHYGDQSPRQPLYFEQEDSIETVYDARCGVLSTHDDNLLTEDSSRKMMTAANLKTCGFTLLVSPAAKSQQDMQNDWNNLEWIQRNRLSQWRDHLEELYSNRPIRHMLFWNPMLRGPAKTSIAPPDRETMSTPKASYAALPHIDMDVNAYDKFEDFWDLIENNKVEILDESEGNISVNRRRQRRQDILDSIQNKNRGFAIVNVWCNVGKHPVRKDPLGLFSVQYDDDNNDEEMSVPAFPMTAPNMNKSRWYAFSNMEPNKEVLFFCQYDRDVSWPSDLWHCSLDGILLSNQGYQQQVNSTSPPRESFDIRCLLAFNEEVPIDRDRFQQTNRVMPLLSLEESGCFCEGQYEERQKEDAVSK